MGRANPTSELHWTSGAFLAKAFRRKQSRSPTIASPQSSQKRPEGSFESDWPQRAHVKILQKILLFVAYIPDLPNLHGALVAFLRRSSSSKRSAEEDLEMQKLKALCLLSPFSKILEQHATIRWAISTRGKLSRTSDGPAPNKFSKFFEEFHRQKTQEALVRRKALLKKTTEIKGKKD